MKKIHIIGASGSGTTTLGKALSNSISTVHFDTDDYYWLHKFSEKREVNERKQILRKDLLTYDDWILSGSLCGWGDEFISYFDLVIFLWIPKNIRIERLQQREAQRYGKEILVGGSHFDQYNNFLEWASLYDEAGMEVRSKYSHEQWMSGLTCPLLRIEGDYTVQERVKIVLEYVQNLRKN
ncbi:AAA family ATPase [Peribacillus butanolivorans]|uniref:ATP-binding protein n=1 Tax=Peribacillus butanolivorans TaxID=421767 RepID=UPI00363D20CA